MKTYSIILASGKGERFGNGLPKQFFKIGDKTILEYSIEAFENNSNIDYVVVVSNPDFIDLTQEIVKKNNYKKVIKVISGGKTRKESSFIGVNSVEETEAKILIHDAVRPFVSERIINDCVDALDKYDAVSVAIETSDTIVSVDKNNFITAVPERQYLRRNQTPQCFKLSVIKHAHKLAIENGLEVTDDCGLVVNLNLTPVYIVEGDNSNIKITYPSDIKI